MFNATPYLFLRLVGIFIFGVGFCVARFDSMGNAKASIRGTSNWYDSHVFLFYKTMLLLGNRRSAKLYRVMKETYESPQIEVVKLELQGVLAYTGGGDAPGW